jgi:hypothetical protein
MMLGRRPAARHHQIRPKAAEHRIRRKQVLDGLTHEYFTVAGSTPASCRICHTVEAAIGWPSRTSSPCTRRCPQRFGQ